MNTTSNLLLISLLALCLCATAACKSPETQPTKNEPAKGTDSAKPAADAKTPADKTAATPAADTKKPADNKAPANTGNLQPGQNDPSFLEGIEGEGALWTKIQTSMGTFNCELYEKKTPNTIANFVGLARGMKAFKDPQTGEFVKRPFYDGIAFHRVIPGFMVQVGDPTGTGRYNPGYRFKDEFVADLKHDVGGILSMANAGPGTNGSQFFITEVPTPHLDNRHTVFGKCNEANIVKEIAAVPKGPRNKPLKPVVIEKVTFYRK